MDDPQKVQLDRITPISRGITVDDFQTNPNVRLFIGDLQAADVRIALTSARYIAFLELPWTPEELVQSVNFNKWIGKKDVVNIYYLFASDTIEERIAKLIESKPSMLDTATYDIEKETASLLRKLMKDY